MLFNDSYLTIKQAAQGLFKDKGSKFLAYAYPFTDETELKEIINNLKLEHAKARHFCFAYRLGLDQTAFRINDDGEPAGTAGRPILNTLLSKELTNILVVVVRYFGGTLLGVPGLINAYKKATEDVINRCEIVEDTVKDFYQIKFEYLQMNDVMKIIKEDNLMINHQNFNLNCEVELAINQSKTNQTVLKFQQIENLTLNYLYSK
jgi:uncharacterized YigZ family protein